MTAELFPVAALGARDCQVIRVPENANPGKTFSRRNEAAVKVTFAAKPLLCARFSAFALVAQLDRASDFESEGREFESLRARHQAPVSAGIGRLHRAQPALGKSSVLLARHCTQIWHANFGTQICCHNSRSRARSADMFRAAVYAPPPDQIPLTSEL